MRAQWFIAVLAAGMLLSAVPAYAANPEAGENGEQRSHDSWKFGHQSRDHASGKAYEEHRLAKLRYMAEYFGIKTEGKSAEQLKTELQAMKTKEPAKWEAFKTEHQAKMLEHLRKKAAENGIATEGKTADQLRQELHKLYRSQHKDGSNRQDKLQNTR